MQHSSQTIKEERTLDKISIDITEKEKLKKMFIKDLIDRVNIINDDYEAKRLWFELTGLNPKTLERYLKGETCPTGVNVINAYKFILNLKDEEAIFKKMPQHALKLYNKRVKRKLTKKSKDITNLILKNDMHYKIFIETMNGNLINIKKFTEDWGKVEVSKAFNYLEKKEIIEKTEAGFYKRGNLNSSFSVVDAHKLLSYLVTKELGAELLEEEHLATSIYFGSVNLSTKGLEDMQDASLDYVNRIYQIEEESFGPHPANFGVASKATQREDLQ